ncbi:predicted protein [Chaetoceros tenuissimus]|uniref:Uncharacterized protein n=1 Tax=Chaetoceros tenuissimus TaxID=426638 RepID=A0AAD3CUS4_9STRA|nr:predicted protein [Chaetoceros tenuissimus]
MSPSKKHDGKKKGNNPGDAESSNSKKKTLKDLIKSGAANEILEKDLPSKMDLFKRGIEKTELNATYRKVIKEGKPGYVNICETNRKKKKAYKMNMINTKFAEFRFVKYDHENSKKYYELDMTKKDALAFVLGVMGQAMNDNGRKTSSCKQEEAHQAIPTSAPAQDDVSSHLDVSSNLGEAAWSNNRSSSSFDNSSLGAQSSLSRETSQSGVKRKERGFDKETERDHDLIVNSVLNNNDDDAELSELFSHALDTEDEKNANKTVEETVANADEELAQENNEWDDLDLEESLDNIVNQYNFDFSRSGLYIFDSEDTSEGDHSPGNAKRDTSDNAE